MQKKPNTRANKAQNRNISKRSKSDKSNSLQNVKPVSNDPKWYSVDPNLLNDVGRVPFSYPTGLPIQLSCNDHFDTGDGVTIPGIAAFNVVPTIGYSDKDSDPVNIAATQMYAFVRHCNSGSVNYDSGDLMLYLLGMADIYSALEYLRRAYGVAQLYSQTNRYLPKSLLRIMGIDPESIIDNLANFRYKFNILVNKASSFAVPATMSIFPRRAFLYQGIYTEGTSPKDQLYLYVPDGFYVYKWTASKLQYMRLDGGGPKAALGLDIKPGSNGFHIMDLLEIVSNMIDLIISNEDMGTMNGDILKAYGDNTIKISHLSEDYYVAPAFDGYVLEQMQNCTTLGTVDSLEITSTYIHDASGVKTGVSILKSHPKVQMASIDSSIFEDYPNAFLDAAIQMRSLGKQIITTSLPDPKPEEVMEITRMAAVFKLGHAEEGYLLLDSGTEFVRSVLVMSAPYKYGEGFKGQYINTASYINAEALFKKDWFESESSTAAACMLMKYEDELRAKETVAKAFKYLPTIYQYDAGRIREVMINYDTLPNVPVTFDMRKDVNPSYISGNISNYAVVTAFDISKLHTTAILNEFAAPHVSIKPMR